MNIYDDNEVKELAKMLCSNDVDNLYLAINMMNNMAFWKMSEQNLTVLWSHMNKRQYRDFAKVYNKEIYKLSKDYERYKAWFAMAIKEKRKDQELENIINI